MGWWSDGPLSQHYRAAALVRSRARQRSSRSGMMLPERWVRRARADILEAFQQGRADGVEIADDGGGAFQRAGEMQQLPAVEELAMTQMHIGERDAVEFHDLRQPRAHPAGQHRIGQAQRRRRRKGMRAPGGQAIDALMHGMAEEMPADQRRQRGDVFGGFLQQHEVGTIAMDQAGRCHGHWRRPGAADSSSAPAGRRRGRIVPQEGVGNPWPDLALLPDGRVRPPLICPVYLTIDAAPGCKSNRASQIAGILRRNIFRPGDRHD